MHVKDERAFRHNTALEHLIASTALFVSEIELGNPNEISIGQSYLLPNNLSISDCIGTKKWHKLQRILYKAFGYSIEQYQYLRPIFIIQQLTELLLNQENQRPLDATLEVMAKDLGKDRIGIELIEEQLAILEAIPLAYQFKSLIEIGQNVKRFRKSVLSQINKYQKQDIKAIYHNSQRQLGKLRKIMIYDRNHKMVNRLMPILMEKPAFMAVGVAHLPGQHGMLRLLKKNGFKVTPLDLQ